ncbi:hypothetical protein WA158_007843 [Blastocystis sp. Blastoise]
MQPAYFLLLTIFFVLCSSYEPYFSGEDNTGPWDSYVSLRDLQRLYFSKEKYTKSISGKRQHRIICDDTPTNCAIPLTYIKCTKKRNTLDWKCFSDIEDTYDVVMNEIKCENLEKDDDIILRDSCSVHYHIELHYKRYNNRLFRLFSYFDHHLLKGKFDVLSLYFLACCLFVALVGVEKTFYLIISFVKVISMPFIVAYQFLQQFVKNDIHRD